MKQQRLKVFLSELEELLADKLFQFSDWLFDDTREKTDILDTKSVQFIVLHSGIAYLAVKNESSRLFILLTEVYEQLPSYAFNLKDCCEKVISKISQIFNHETRETFLSHEHEPEITEETITESLPEENPALNSSLVLFILKVFRARSGMRVNQHILNQIPVKPYKSLYQQNPYQLVPG
jgi:hypothetical protein